MLYREVNRKPPIREAMPKQEPFGVTDALDFIRDAKWPIAICASLFGALALAYVFLVQPMYTAVASVYLQNQKGLVIGKEANGAVPMDVGEIETQMEVIRSQRVANEVVRNVDLENYLPLPEQGEPDRAVPFLDGVLERLGLKDSEPVEPVDPKILREEQKLELARQGLVVRRPGLSFTVEISYTAKDPVLAANLANAYAQAYIMERRNQRREAIREATAWMEQRAAQIRQEAEAAFTAVEEYREANIGVRMGQDRVNALPAESPEQRRVKLKQLETTANTLQRTYETFIERLAETTQQQSAPGADAIILNQAAVPESPSYPKKKLTLMLALIAGAGIGATVTLLRRLLTPSFGAAAQLRPLGVPLLGKLPLAPMNTRVDQNVAVPRVLPSRGMFDQTRSRLQVSNAAGSYRAIVDAPDIPFSEAIRHLKIELDLSGVGQEIRTLGILSAGAGQEASIIGSNLAHLFALQGSAILLDADVTNSDLSRALVPSAPAGLAGVVAGSVEFSEALAEDQVTRLRVLPCEPAQARPELRLSIASPQRLTQVFELARAQADIIVVNLAEANSAATKIVLPHLDAIMILADPERARTANLAAVVGEIEARGGRVLGVALCRSSEQAPRSMEKHASSGRNRGLKPLSSSL